MARLTLEQYDIIFQQNGLSLDTYRGINGEWKPILPSIVGRPLNHTEMDYNLELLDEVVKNYRVLKADGSIGEL